MKKIISLAVLLFALQGQASAQMLKCVGEVFYFAKNNAFQIPVSYGLSNIEYQHVDGDTLAYFSVRLGYNSNKTVFHVTSEANEGGAVYMKIDLNARKGQMISLYETPWDMNDDNPYTEVGTCVLR